MHSLLDSISWLLNKKAKKATFQVVSNNFVNFFVFRNKKKLGQMPRVVQIRLQTFSAKSIRPRKQRARFSGYFGHEETRNEKKLHRFLRPEPGLLNGAVQNRKNHKTYPEKSVHTCTACNKSNDIVLHEPQRRTESQRHTDRRTRGMVGLSAVLGRGLQNNVNNNIRPT